MICVQNLSQTVSKPNPKPMRASSTSESVDAYIDGFDGDIGERLKAMRKAIAAAVPEAVETISYGMPTFRLDGNLVHFAAAKKHIGFYPGPSGIEAFAQDLAPFKSSKGAVQFPYDQPLPLETVQKISRFRADENRANAATRKA